MTEDTRAHAQPPLYVDLDGTLVATDTLIENVRLLLRRRPWMVFLLPFYILAGRASFKEHVARRATIDPSELPYRGDVLEFLREEKVRGRKLVLATAAHRLVAIPVARHIDIFDDVLATDESHNLKGRAKLAAIRDHAAGGAFAYMGDSRADLPILQAAAAAYLVHPSSGLLTAARSSCRIERVFD